MTDPNNSIPTVRSRVSRVSFSRRATDHPRTVWPFVTLAVIGVSIVLLAVGLWVYGSITGHEIKLNYGVLIVGAIVGFVGLYPLNPRTVQSGATFLVDSSVKIIGALPRGRRSTDAVAVPEATTQVTATPVVVPSTSGTVAPPGADAPTPPDDTRDGGRP